MLPHFIVHAQTATYPINATVKLSVCGDGVAEGSEDCDGSDFRNLTCVDYGFAAGTLACDVACDIDTTGCSGTAPTPTPTPTPTPGGSGSSGSENSSSGSSGTTSSSSTPTPTPELPLILTILVPSRPQPSFLSKILGQYDINRDGRLDDSDFLAALNLWLQQHRVKEHTCDMNNDGVCNLVDLSIILYYVNREPAT
jgi:hypothetical protein